MPRTKPPYPPELRREAVQLTGLSLAKRDAACAKEHDSASRGGSSVAQKLGDNLSRLLATLVGDSL
jgi:hypothetical protein